LKIKLNIVYKLIGYLVVVSLLPLLIFAFLSYAAVRDTIFELSSKNSSQLIGNQRDYLQQQVIAQVENLSARIAGNELINAILARSIETPNSSHSTFDELSSQEQIRTSLTLFGYLKGIVSVDIIGADGYRYYAGDTLAISPMSEQRRSALMKEALNDPEPLHWLGVVDNLNTESPSGKVLSAVKVLHRYNAAKQTTVNTGLLIISYSTEVLYDHFSHIDLGPNSGIYILDAFGKMIYSPDRAQIGQMAPDDLQRGLNSASNNDLINFKGIESLISRARLEGQSWNVVGIIPRETLLSPMNRLTEVLLMLIVLSFVVIGLASQFFRRTMVMPVQAISEGFRRLYDKDSRHVEHLPVPKTDDEISELVVWFNTFLETHAMRLQYEKDLIESQYKFSSIFKQAPMPLVLVRIGTSEFIDVNDFWLDQFGYSRDEVIGRTTAELNMWVNQDDRNLVLNQINHTQVVNRLEIRQRTKDGRILICQVSGRPLRFQDEFHFIFTPVDITRQRKTELEINEINQQLESRVMSRTEQLQKTNEDLNQALETLNMAHGELARSEKLAALGSLVAGVAHEINTPVGIIVTSASVLSDASIIIDENVQQGVIRKSQVLEYIRVALESSRLISANANRAAHLIQSFKQVAVDQTSEQRRIFDLNVFLAELITSLNPSLKKSKISIGLDLADEKIRMDSYPGLLAQALTNLTMNALIHAFHHRSHGKISIAISLHNDMVSIQFKDDGCGIASNILDKIFDPFFTTRRGQGGTGLGLNIVFNIISKQLGGVISAHNNPEGGALFQIVIPRVTRELTEKEYIRDALT